jgi:signal transduction histidine kinase
MGKDALLRHLSHSRPARRVGRSQLTAERRRGELLAAVYLAGDLGVLGAWLADPADIGNRVGMGVLSAFVLCCAVALFALRDRLPAYAGDAAIAGSLLLITAANLFGRLHAHPGLFTPYYVWVGFASPMWLPRARAVAYVGLTAVASGAVALVAGTAVALAGWLVIVATLVVAFVTVDSLTRALVERERLAAVGEMASMVTHELRNPLGVVTNAVFLVRHALGDTVTPEVEQHLLMADREVDKANAIIDHMVAFVRPRQPELAPVPVRDVVAEVLETTPAPDGVTVRVDVGSVTPVADRGHLAEILVNLVSNAYDALAGGGTVRIGAVTHDHSAVLTVEDDGAGFDRDLSDRIFEPFFTTKHTGTGLGLAIVRRLADINRGEISVASGVAGTCFTLTLPAPRTPAPPAGHGPATGNGSAS